MSRIRRRKGTGSIRLLHGKFRFCIRIAGYEKSFSLPEAKNEKEANVQADALLRQFGILKEIQTKEELALFVGKTKKILTPTPQILLSDGFKLYLKSISRPHCCEEFLRQKKVVWDHFVSFCLQTAVLTLDGLTDGLLLDYRDSLIKCRKPKTCNEHLCTVKQILRIIGCDAILFDCLKPFPFVSEPMQFFSSEELSAIMSAVDGEMKLSLPYREEMKVLFRILAWSGLRLKDACLFQWREVNLDKKIILTRPHKTERSSGALVALPIHPDLEKALQTALQWRDDSGYVLPHVAKRYLANKSCLQHEVARTIDWTFWTDKKPNRRPPKAGRYGAHSFRHTFATFLMNNGVDPEIIAKMLGQKSLAITRIYMHLIPQTVQKIMADLPKLD